MGRHQQHKITADEWIVTSKNGSTYLYDDFKKTYVRYVLGYGLFDDFGKLIADENSEYYREVIKRIDEVQANPELAYKEPLYKPKIKPGVKEGAKRGQYSTSKKKNNNRKLYTKVCLECHREFTTFNKRRNYCNGACRQRAYRKRKARKEMERKKSILLR